MQSLKIAMTVLSLGFGASRPVTHHEPGFAVTGQSQPGSWRGSTGDLSVAMRFEHRGDSIYARGTYRVGPRKRVGCGGETLPSSGTFTMRGKGDLNSFQGKFLFDSGWTPPASAKQKATGAIKINLGSVDRGPCVMTLERRT